MKQKYIVWSLDPEESQTFIDIVMAVSPARAAAQVQRKRPYATLDSAVEPMLLVDHIVALLKEADVNPLVIRQALSAYEGHMRVQFPGLTKQGVRAPRDVRQTYCQIVSAMDTLKGVN